ncbi:streptophobe family protein [Streptomyces sp. NBC_01003]|uniref:streptophobe family protein n=1 Tax=Streptomyces sp. NBC_01003 TaxID=2903714 RepID=UPI0038687F75|nr:streptophobe family protein [Streptomyces sp. NBC_01003]
METVVRRSGREGVHWGDVLLSAVASVSWAFIGMATVAAAGLHLLGADSAGPLGPMTAAVVALGAGGKVTPSGDVSAFGLEGAQAHTTIDIAPLGVGLTGALLLSWFFLRSLRGAGVEVTPAELAARVGSVVALFLAMLAGLAWAGHDLITIDGGKLGLDRIPDGDLPGRIKDRLPGGLDLGGLLPDHIGGLVDAKATVGFTVETGASLLGGAAWVIGVLLIALLASRRTPLPRSLDAVHRVVRPAASSLVTVLLVAVAAGLAAAAYAVIGDDHPRRIVGAALLGAPNGAWLGIPLGLFVPWDGKATGALAQALPHPVDGLLRMRANEPVTLSRLAELDGRVWLLALAMVLVMLLAGVLTAVRTPAVAGGPGSPPMGVVGFAGRCALRLGAVTALGLPLLVRLTDVSADASLSVLGFDAFGAGIELHGHLGMALLLGAAWGAAAGAVGALLAHGAGAAGRRAAPAALGGGGVEPEGRVVDGAPGDGAVRPVPPVPPQEAGPYRPSAPYRGSPDGTNPYLKPPDERAGDGRDDLPDDLYGAPTMVGPVRPPVPPRPRGRPGSGSGKGGWPVPPPPPPPPPLPHSPPSPSPSSPEEEGPPPPRRSPRG